MKYCFTFVFLLFNFINVNVNGYNLTFELCGKYGWSCNYTEDGTIDLVFDCTLGFEEKEPTITWRISDLPSATQAVTLQNCDVNLILGADLKLDSSPFYRYWNNYFKLRYLKSITIKNVTDLEFKNDFYKNIEKLSGQASIILEDVKQIKTTPSFLINGDSSFNKNRLEGLNFVMKNVNIGLLKKDTVYWEMEDIPLRIVWENVSIREMGEGSQGSIYIKGVDEPHKLHQVFIKDSKFGTITGFGFELQNINYFYFTNNQIDSVEQYAFHIKSEYVIISKNVFHHINDKAFSLILPGINKNSYQFESNTIHSSDELSMIMWYDGPILVEPVLHCSPNSEDCSFRGNKFNCDNAKWMQRSDRFFKLNHGKKGYYNGVLISEKNIYNNADNVCIDWPRPISVNKFREHYKLHGSGYSRAALN